MAYIDDINGYLTANQANRGEGFSLNPTGKAPVIANRIFDTYAHMKAYVDKATSSAIPGLILSVFGDTKSSNNGVYRVVEIGDGEKEGTLEKIGTSTLTVDDYFDALGLTKSGDTEVGQVIYVLNDATTGLEGDTTVYKAGLYVVTEVGANATLVKIGTVEATGGDVTGAIVKAEGIGGDTIRFTSLDGETQDVKLDTVTEEKNGVLSSTDYTIFKAADGKIKALTDSVVAVSGVVDTAIDGVSVAYGPNNQSLILQVNKIGDAANAEPTMVGNIPLATANTPGIISADIFKQIQALNSHKLFEIVSTLPTSGESNTIYLVAEENTDTNNIYVEYIYTNGAWEKVGEYRVDNDTITKVSAGTASTSESLITVSVEVTKDPNDSNTYVVTPKVESSIRAELVTLSAELEGFATNAVETAIGTEISARNKAITDATTELEGKISSAKTEIIGTATTGYNTLGKLETEIKKVKSATVTIEETDSNSHIVVSAEEDETTGAITYTIEGNDIASEAALTGHTTNGNIHVDSTEKTKLSKIVTNGDGTKVLSDKGIYVDPTQYPYMESMELALQHGNVYLGDPEGLPEECELGSAYIHTAINNESTDKVQFCYEAANGTVHVRSKVDDQTDWTEWKRFATTEDVNNAIGGIQRITEADIDAMFA